MLGFPMLGGLVVRSQRTHMLHCAGSTASRLRLAATPGLPVEVLGSLGKGCAPTHSLLGFLMLGAPVAYTEERLTYYLAGSTASRLRLAAIPGVLVEVLGSLGKGCAPTRSLLGFLMLGGP